MRLIDADLLKKNIAKWLQGSDPQETEMVRVDDIAVSVIMEIDEQPTAYDVEKVVEQIKELSFEAEIVIPQSDGYDDTATKEIISTPIATEIVKEGGAE